jgi:hypothetical protein
MFRPSIFPTLLSPLCGLARLPTRPGDFYLTRSLSGDFVVQVRQFACGRTVSCNQAVRIRYGSSTVTLDPAYRFCACGG